jgi:hypothetical protein
MVVDALRPTMVRADGDDAKLLTVVSGSTVYYGGANVSGSNNDGSITVGSSVTITQSKYLISVSGANVAVKTVPSVKGFVNHGSVATVPRPNYASVEWVGTVEPVNAIDIDTWIDIS